MGDWNVVVVGAGMAGLTVARRLAELGIRNLVLERGQVLGEKSNTGISGGILHVAWAGMNRPSSVLNKHLQEATDGHIDSELAAAFAANAGRALGWLVDKGVPMVVKGPNDEPVHALVPREPRQLASEYNPARGPARALNILLEGIDERMSTIVLGARAESLHPSEGERWSITLDVDGEKREVVTQNVVFADGGFQANKEMLTRYVGPHASYALPRCNTGGTGTGLSLLLEQGAAAVGLSRVYGHTLAASATTIRTVWPQPTVDALCLSGLLVDRVGRRYPTLAENGVQLVNELVRTEDPRGFTAIFDQTTWDSYREETPYGGVAPNPTLIDEGAEIRIAGSIDQLGHACGFDSSIFVDSAAEHRRWRASGLDVAPFYALPIIPGITFTMGGARIDNEAAVLDLEGQRIPGLWAAGSTAGGLHGGPRGGYVGGLAAGLVFGLLAAEGISRSQQS